MKLGIAATFWIMIYSQLGLGTHRKASRLGPNVSVVSADDCVGHLLGGQELVVDVWLPAHDGIESVAGRSEVQTISDGVGLDVTADNDVDSPDITWLERGGSCCGGHKVTPWFYRKRESGRGEELFERAAATLNTEHPVDHWWYSIQETVKQEIIQ